MPSQYRSTLRDSESGIPYRPTYKSRPFFPLFPPTIFPSLIPLRFQHPCTATLTPVFFTQYKQNNWQPKQDDFQHKRVFVLMDMDSLEAQQDPVSRRQIKVCVYPHRSGD